MTKASSFTVAYNGRSRELSSDVSIVAAFDPATLEADKHPPFKNYKGIWDTGATASVITQKVVDEIGLKPIGMTQVHHAHGTTSAEVYLVNIGLPNGVAFASMSVTRGELASADVLVGMDIIGKGDFAVTNYGAKTVFTYRVPSTETLDFTGQVNATPPPPAPKVGRNAPCPCGSGKKFKKCCAGKAPPTTG